MSHLVSNLFQRCASAWRNALTGFHHDQVGAGYSLSVVLMLPLYIAFMGMTVEVHLLLNSHQSVQAALQTAGHAARAWTTHQDALAQSGSSLVDQVHQSVALNLLPFATSKTPAQTTSQTELTAVLQAAGLSATAIERYASKLAYMDKALRINIVPQVRTSDGLLVQIEYDSPLWLPIFESVWATGYIDGIPIRTVRAETWVALLPDQSQRTSLGIPYAPQTVQSW